MPAPQLASPHPIDAGQARGLGGEVKGTSSLSASPLLMKMFLHQDLGKVSISSSPTLIEG